VAERGKFVVIEGIDGAGTTTQAAKLAERLRTSRKLVKATREPSDGPIGTLVRQVLTGRIVAPGGRAPGWATMALLFAADRLDHVEAEIEPALASGAIVISDRYDASSLGYQSIMSGGAGGESIEWIRTLNRHVLRPDLTLVLEVGADLAAVRRDERGEVVQLYEQNEVQRALVAFYRDLDRYLPNDRIAHVDAVGSVEEVHERILAVYGTTFGGLAS
jgi:dTMP kinase